MTFGIQREGKVLQDYMNEYIVVTLQNGVGNPGMLSGIKEGYLLLMPYVGKEYTDDYKLGKKIFEEGKPLAVHVSLIADITPITRRSLENFCKFANHDFTRDEIKKEIEFRRTIEPTKNFEVYEDGLGI